MTSPRPNNNNTNKSNPGQLVTSNVSIINTPEIPDELRNEIITKFGHEAIVNNILFTPDAFNTALNNRLTMAVQIHTNTLLALCPPQIIVNRNPPEQLSQQTSHSNNSLVKELMSNGSSMVIIYILKLTEGKYYVGKTNDAFRRIEDHKSNSGSAWTKIYEPIEIINIYDNCSDFDEDKYTFEMMAKYGIDNVRGGSFVKIDLPQDQIKVLTTVIRSNTGKCFICGSSKHFVSDCQINKEKYSSIFKTVEFEQSIQPTKNNKKKREYNDINNNNSNNFNSCFTCGQPGHFAKNCYAKPSSKSPIIFLRPYYDKEFKSEKSAILHAKKCQSKAASKTRSTSSIKSAACFKCGRAGHLVNDCFAAKHIKGYFIK